MVDIVIRSDSVLQMHIVVDGSKNIFLRNMLRDQFMNRFPDCILDVFRIFIFFQYFFKNRIVY